MGGRW
jgi:hypothetical protein